MGALGLSCKARYRAAIGKLVRLTQLHGLAKIRAWQGLNQRLTARKPAALPFVLHNGRERRHLARVSGQSSSVAPGHHVCLVQWENVVLSVFCIVQHGTSNGILVRLKQLHDFAKICA